MAAALVGSVAVLLVRWLRPGDLSPVWWTLAGVLAIGAGAAWLGQRRRFESPATARVRLEDALGLKARLSAAAVGVGSWPAPVDPLRWPVRWRWQRPLAVAVFSIAMLAISARVPVAPRGIAKQRIIERPPAVREVEQWIQELRREEAVAEKSAEEVDQRIAELLRRPAENWYEHGSLEAAGNLKEQTAADLRELSENLADAQRAAAALQAMGDSAPQAVRDSLAGGLEKAASSLTTGGMRPNEQLLRQLQGIKPSDLKKLPPEQMKRLAEQLRKNSEALAKCLGNCPGFDASGIPTQELAATQGKESGPDGDGTPGSGGLNRGRADAEMFLKKDETSLDTRKTESVPTQLDADRAAPADVLAVTDGRHEVDKAGYQGPVQGGAIRSVGDGGSAVWRSALVPAEREVLKRYFR